MTNNKHLHCNALTLLINTESVRRNASQSELRKDKHPGLYSKIDGVNATPRSNILMHSERERKVKAI